MVIEILRAISYIFGWFYVALWGFSCYPQAILNYQLKSVAGFSIDFGIMHMTGFLLYSIYCFGGFTYAYMGTGDIQLVDLFFPTHCFLISSVNLSQIWIYKRGSQTSFDKRMVILVTIIWIMTALWFILEAVVGVRFPNIINTFLLVGYFKTIITFAKYLPQVSLNYRRKSTKGLSITYICLDLSGCIFAMLQQFIDLFVDKYTNPTHSHNFNYIKLLISLVSASFDILQIIQKYILYPEIKGRLIDDTKDTYRVQMSNMKPLLD
ncbi:unnamed protein product [Moneuplotes crassus]|uniref:Uncharacterized protein n=1 Tax=Euplotes crassus TaxID=5936 RepID=A0AAD2D2A5_EUPCR|nr:unnamed protein product [Moneuplotes crassus]